jgi:hypothetical protein
MRRTGMVSIGRLAAAVFAIAVPLNFLWEVAPSPLYASLPPFPAGVWHCFVASLGDGLLIVLVWIVGWAVFRRLQWFGRPHVGGYLLMLTTGIVLGVIVESAGLRTGRWSYEPRMPRVGHLGIVPLAQMVLLPPLTFALAARTRWVAFES